MADREAPVSAAVDRSGMIVKHALTEATVDGAPVGVELIGAAVGPVASLTAEAAYATDAFYEAASARLAQVVLPPIITARVSRHGPRSSVRARVTTKLASARATALEEGLGLPSAGSRRKRLLSAAGGSRRALRALC